MRTYAAFGAGLAAVLAHASAHAAPVPRQGPVDGRIVATKQGETAVLQPAPQQRPAEVRQDLKAGDVLRTNAAGTLAIVFADRTQIRIGRNSTLVVKRVQRGVPSSIQLQRGSVWARSPRGASQLSVETPSATAAIRGTEYSIVATDEQTTLTVVEGAVDFFNPQGQLQVAGGQAAAARLGQAPARLVTVNPDSREQMLYYLSLEGALASLSPAPVQQRAAREAVARVKAIAPADRMVEDWLTLAECGVGVESRTAVEEALAKARAQTLSPVQDARAKLVEANIATKTRDFRGALRLYEEAMPLVSGRQKVSARYGAYMARILIDPANAKGDLPALDPKDAQDSAGQAFLAAYAGDFARSRSMAEAGLTRFPDEMMFYTILAGIGLLTGDEKAMDEASQRALQVDPDDPFANRVRTELAMHYRGDPEGAVANARRGTEIAPGNDEMWNVLALALHGWDQERQAERAIERGLAEAPNSFVLHSNRAIILFQQMRLAEMRKELDYARALDPDNAVTHLAEAAYSLSYARREEAIAHALDASAANPLYAEAAQLLAEMYYDDGNYQLAMQQLDAADRADPNSPFISLYRAAFAIDSYRADDAIIAAREALRRYRARGGIYQSLNESKGTGSRIAGAFRLLGLAEWARYYGDRAYDPFVPAALFDRALNAAPSPYLPRQTSLPDPETSGFGSSISDNLQGLRLDPLSISGPSRELNLTRQKFIELVAVPSLTVSDDRATLAEAATINGLVVDPLPIAYAVSASRSRLDLPIEGNNRQRSFNLLAGAGIKASPYDNIVVAGTYGRQRTPFTGTIDAPRGNGALRDTSGFAYGVYAHQFDRENYLTLGGAYADTKRVLRRDDLVPFNIDPPLALGVQYRELTRTESWVALGNYAVGLGKVELQAGGEYFKTRVRNRGDRAILLPPLDPDFLSQDRRFVLDQYRAYSDLRFVPSDRLIVEGQVALSGVKVRVAGIDASQTDSNFDFSGGVAFSPGEGQWLRAAFVRSANVLVPLTLAPTSVVGLRPAEAPVGNNVRSDSFVGRWEAEWTPHVFTSIEYQHQKFDALSFEKANFIDPIVLETLINDEPLGIQSLVVGPSRLDRVSASASFWLTGNVGLRAVYAYSDSEVESGPGAGRPIPFISRHFARGQVTWTSSERIRLSGGISYLSPRVIAIDGTRSESVWTSDVQLTMESADKRMQFTAGLLGLFEKVDVIPGLPSFGRTATASLEFRF